MKQLTLFIFGLVLIGFSACTSQPTPEPVAQATIFVPATQFTLPATFTTIPTITFTPIPTATPTPTVTFTPTTTPTPTITFTPSPTNIASPTLTSTPTPIPPTKPAPPELVWNMPIIHELEGSLFLWSPVANEGVSSNCIPWETSISQPNMELFFASAPTFAQEKISPEDLYCVPFFNWQWSVDGLVIYFFQPLHAEGPENYSIWRITTDGTNLEQVVSVGNGTQLNGWLNDQWLVWSQSTGWAFGGIYVSNIATLQTYETNIGIDSSVFFGAPSAIVTIYTTTSSSSPQPSSSEQFFSALVIVIAEGETQLFTSEKHYLSFDPTASNGSEYLFNSYPLGLLPDKQQILVLTWSTGVNLTGESYLDDPTLTKLQLWNFADNSLTEVVQGAIDGLVSPTGEYLAYVAVTDNQLALHLLNQTTAEVEFNYPIYGYSQDIYAQPQFSFDRKYKFSPDGRFLTFHVKTHAENRLIVYDIKNQTIMADLPSTSFYLDWSPNSQKFTYQAGNGYYHVYDVASQKPIPLIKSGNQLILDQKWSFDGSYLALSVRQPDQTTHIVIIESAAIR